MKNTVSNLSGFTLVELLVVVLIIGILAAAALPQYRETVMRSRLAEAASTMGALERAYSACVAGKRHASTAGCTAEELGITVAGPNDGGWGYRVYETPSNTCNGTGANGIPQGLRICAVYDLNASTGALPVLSAVYRNGTWIHYCGSDYESTAKLCRSLASAGYGTI